MHISLEGQDDAFEVCVQCCCFLPEARSTAHHDALAGDLSPCTLSSRLPVYPVGVPAVADTIDIDRRMHRLAVAGRRLTQLSKQCMLWQVEPSERSASSVQSASSLASTLSGSGYGHEAGSAPASRVSSFSNLRPGTYT